MPPPSPTPGHYFQTGGGSPILSVVLLLVPTQLSFSSGSLGLAALPGPPAHLQVRPPSVFCLRVYQFWFSFCIAVRCLS